MARWAALEWTRMEGSTVLSNGQYFGLSTALAMVLAIMGMVAMISMVLGVCTQLHNRVQSKEISDGEMSVGPGQKRKGGGGEGGRMNWRSGGGGGGSSSSKKRLLFLQSMGGCRGVKDDDEEEKDEHKLHATEDGDEVRALQGAAGNMESGPVWKRSILMGERCEPPAFSGLILYDEHGNLVQDLPWRSPRRPSSPSLRQLLTSTT